MEDLSALDHIFTFWTGDTPINPGRSAALSTVGQTGLRHIHLAGPAIQAWEKPEMPFHPAYGLLSEVHKADYLRCYFMHAYGGGYTDIKFHTHSWREPVSAMLQRQWLVGIGYREVRGGTTWLQRNTINGQAWLLSHRASPWQAVAATNLMRAAYPIMIGNGAFFFRPHTWFTKRWYSEVCRRLDVLTPALRLNPPLHARDRLGGIPGMPHNGYPVPWSFLLGDILGPLGLMSSFRLSRGLPAISTDRYLD